MIKKLFKFAYDNKNSGLDKINSVEDFQKRFDGESIKSETKLHKAYEKAWDARKFEIDNYWKRTTYFWAFQITSFTAYLAVLNSDSYNSTPPKNPEILYCIISFGFITSLSWVLINIGSKFWQRHWEKQIDMLEDQVTGPLYKTIYAYKTTKTFSVSKINEMISRFFTVIWTVLGIKYGFDNLTFAGTYKDIAYVEIIVTLVILYFVLAMFRGHGRGNFAKAKFEYYDRGVFEDQP
ncbi:MAG TPA: hypothetical protein VK151_17580 [Fluviicola sp.]|nr:hypothetical protein [Fluviicola sp.]